MDAYEALKETFDDLFQQAVEEGCYTEDEAAELVESLDIYSLLQVVRHNATTVYVQAEEKALREKRLAALKAILNAKQYRRIWLYYAERKSVTEIARLEGVTKASVSLSLARAIKKISKKFAAGLKNS